MTEKVVTKIIILHETVLQSYLIDTSTFALFASLIGLGIYLDSTVMQWVGAGMGMLTLASRFNRKERMTIAQARVLLDELEAAL